MDWRILTHLQRVSLVTLEGHDVADDVALAHFRSVVGSLRLRTGVQTYCLRRRKTLFTLFTPSLLSFHRKNQTCHPWDHSRNMRTMGIVRKNSVRLYVSHTCVLQVKPRPWNAHVRLKRQVQVVGRAVQERRDGDSWKDKQMIMQHI